jgi:hypothetical protein
LIKAGRQCRPAFFAGLRFAGCIGVEGEQWRRYVSAYPAPIKNR